MKSLEIPWFGEVSRRKKWMVAVSGGLDSMALLHLMHEAGFSKIVVCHLNHGFRGKASEEDARFVSRVAKKFGYEFEGKTIVLTSLMAESGESLETAGRRARHEFFSECSRKHRCKSIVLAHHADDQAETVLWNLMRGSHGCRGMNEQSEIDVSGKNIEMFRPLLAIRKSVLQKWMREMRFTWREDASNQVNDVARNRIRNEAMPLLCDIARRDVVPLFARAVKADSATRDLVSWALEKAAVYDPQGRLHLGVLRELPAKLQVEAIKDLLERSEISRINQAMLERCIEILDVAAPASTNLPGGFRLRRKANRLFVDVG